MTLLETFERKLLDIGWLVGIEITDILLSILEEVSDVCGWGSREGRGRKRVTGKYIIATAGSEIIYADIIFQ